MAIVIWRQLWWLAILLLLPSHDVDCRNVTITNEDIRDAILSLLHMYRTTDDKLERHEFREKALGEHLKKSIIGLEKRHRALEPLKGIISRLDERLSNVETVLLQKEEREKVTQKKTNDALEHIQQSLQALVENFPSGARAGSSGHGAGDSTNVEAKLDAVQQDLALLKNALTKESLRAMCLEMGSDGNPLEKHISEAEKLLNKYELKLNEYNGNSSRVPTDFVPLNEVAIADEAWHSKMSEVMERQEKDIKKIQQLLSDAEGFWKDLPRLSDIRSVTNQTLAAVQTASELSKENIEKSVEQLSQKLRELSQRLVSTNEDIQRSLTQSNTMGEQVYNDISKSYAALHNEVKTLTKNENVMLQTADNVLATKKRIEYGVYQILVEVGDLIKIESKNLNRTINDKFESIQTVILENTSEALTNLSSKIELEMSQVWRQIGIMYQQLSASKMSLDKLTEQTEQYVNSSANVMDNMKDKVGLITSRMTEVDENLNYLLGRLSLVTQEFNHIKTGLGDALDKVKASFLTVQAKLEDAGPGPHNITSAENV